ncbi:neprilysin-like [Discoglossus pictus]
MDLPDVNTSGRRKRYPLSTLEKGLLSLVVVLGIIAIAMIIAYATYNDGICKTQGCVKAASRVLTNMDPTAEPCKNFYQYSCGGWLKKNVIPDTSITHDAFAVLRVETQAILKDALEKKNSSDIAAIRKAKILYQSCVDENTKNLRKGEPLIKNLPDIFDWPVAMDDWETKYGSTWSAEKSVSHALAKYGRSGLIFVFVTGDVKDSNANGLYIDQPPLGLPSKDYYQCNSTKEICTAYEEQMVSVAKLIRMERNLSIDETQIRADIAKIFELEKEIANAKISDEVRGNPNNVYNKMTISQVIKDHPLTINGENFDWLNFINAVIKPGGVSVKEEENVIVYASDYLKKMASFVTKYNARELQNYIGWRLVFGAVEDLSREYKATAAALRKALYGTTTETALWRTCVSYLNNNLDDVVGRLYVQETFSEDSKKEVLDLIEGLVNVFNEMLDEAIWMDNETKQKAKKKAAKIEEQIAYPDDIMNDDELNKVYAELEYVADEYFENKLKNLEYGQKKSASKLREPVDKTQWVTGPAQVNAFYASTKNQIVFPAGILQPPFFSSSQPKALNYGGIGTIIGHEISHGFDNKGKNFDENGDLVNWWTNKSAKSFDDLSMCFVKQYGNFTWDVAGGQNLNGVTTLAENIADNGGLRDAFRAYKNYVRTHEKEKRLPGVDLTEEQLFFLSFGQVWCGMYRPEYAVTSITTDSHSPGIFRVIGSLQNFPEFSEAFSCKTNDYMNPSHKCRLW